MKGAALWLAAALLPLPAFAAPESEHVVSEGETLNGIANRAGVSSKALAEANALKPPYPLRTGQRLKLPPAVAAPAKAISAQTRPPSASTASVAKATPAAKPSGPANAAGALAFGAGSGLQESVHVVAAGETLMGIANRARVPRVLIAEANGLAPPYTVRVGQKLLIPRTRRYRVEPGDTGFKVAYKTAVPWNQIAIANGIDADAPLTPGKELLIPTVLNAPAPAGAAPASAEVAASRAAAASAADATMAASAVVAAATAPAGRKAARFAWPLDGTVRRGWTARGTSNRHDGLDIAAPRGTPVRAAAPGTVIYAGSEEEQFGNLVVIDHGEGWHTAYGFLSKINVKAGAKITAGDRVGLVGDSGRARGNELHFEVRQNGAPVDPAAELPETP